MAVAGQYFARLGAAAPRIRWGLNGYLLASYMLFLARGVLWTLVLRRTPVSRAYPVLSAAYPLVLVLDVLAFGEDLTLGAVLGTVLIVSGLVLMVPREAPWTS